MAGADTDTLAKVRGALEPGTRCLLRHVGVEDHGEIVWATFSDDSGRTLIVYRVQREDVTSVFSLLDPFRLREGLTEARGAGLTRVVWGIEP